MERQTTMTFECFHPKLSMYERMNRRVIVAFWELRSFWGLVWIWFDCVDCMVAYGSIPTWRLCSLV